MPNLLAVCRFLPLTLVAAVTGSAAAPYSFSDLTFPNAAYTYPVSINNHDVIAGYYLDSSFASHGFTYRKIDGVDVYNDIEGGGNCFNTFISGINDEDVLSGYCDSLLGGMTALTVKNGIVTYYSVSGALDTEGHAINSQGVTIGSYVTDAGVTGSFIASQGKILRTFEPANGGLIRAIGINDSNEIVGTDRKPDQTGRSGFTLKGGVYASYNYPGASETIFTGINNSSEIVGYYTLPSSPRVAFTFHDDFYSIIDIPESLSSVADGINDAGVIVGAYLNKSGVIIGYMATP